MKYDSLEHAATHHQKYPALDRDLMDHDFQRRRVSSGVRFIQPGDKVLDVACNSGYYRDYVPTSVEVHGVDINPSLVEIARTRLASAQVAAAEALPFDDGSFDVVNLSGLLEQVYEPLPVVVEAARVSRRYVIGNTTHHKGTWGKQRTADHLWQSRSYTEAEITHLLQSIGDIVHLGTVDVNSPPEPQCWHWCVDVRGAK